MKNPRWLLCGFIVTVALMHLIQAQNQQGFISLDCGLSPNGSPYTEPSTGLIFTSDVNSIQSGKTGRIQKEFEPNFMKPYLMLRYFPDGTRNCYNLNVTKGTSYLIKATFVYGNYDGQNNYPSFDLYMGPNIWTTVDLSGRVNGTVEEIIHVPSSKTLDVCLVKTGTTTPMISALELRPLRNGSYVTESGSLKYFFRVYFSNSGRYIRYPDDIFDRKWYSYFQPEWTQITTSQNVSNSNTYEPPVAALATAATPTNATAPLTITWNLKPPTSNFYLYVHFAEIQNLSSNASRAFNVLLNGENTFGPYSPKRLEIETLFDKKPEKCDGGKCVWQLAMTPNSTLPPLVSAIEAFTVIDFPLSETDQDDVFAIKNIKDTYEVSRVSWQGDPCLPQQFTWDGLNCSDTDTFTSPRITSLVLSSSGLTGSIASTIQNLTELRILDLSNNNLTGGVPEFLAGMKSLTLINLSGNNLTGSVPQALLDKRGEGLELKLNGNPKLLCQSVSCDNLGGTGKHRKKSVVVPVVASVASVLAVLVAGLALFFVFKKKKQANANGRVLSVNAQPDGRSPQSSQPSIVPRNRRFSYPEVQAMTNNFQRILGKGGFGVVYHGYVNGTEQVAVKMLSESSAQGYKQFKAEVELLLRVHHKNLVSLVGYCDEGDNLALVYEYMANGDLKEHLSGKRGGSVLNWGTRLKIVAEAAQGLEYLHNGCKPPMVHRDVKTTNILLNEHLQSKLADFGLSRSFPTEGETHVSTVVAGTPGYLDPEYYRTNWLTEKSDVYSFGIVLLEIITNRPVIDQTREKPHITEWVGLMLTRGDIGNIMDPKLYGDYDRNSVWKVVELGMSCVNPSSSRRPNMSQVVIELNECLASEKSRVGTSGEMDSKSSIEVSMTYATELSPKAR
ncbi:PREDICTED: probable LRR receptor-like serine/threonine-protein kinase At1g51820 isoform X2 [Tarenaya hassleriana]|uniref:probable LRR receptor-like serine/threonine-protein kinase At1g51820 isoform X1 n=1 Tax=Tarenaya hassleriana TaxID=28532 RepID=UPI00053C6C53|nr:PREDICTED: probable LRR receptor-like serine/threonine-protein kinase At1g51820 isoform X1 [Tarenaya hassleriana]XP_010545650.1 PREDICTED: probable LRR receptor-like serine/threonine-protein kinase At1g51820 isoform X2 [Tarenaya hassleriana]